jgi:phosphopantetheinyl transferase
MKLYLLNMACPEFSKTLKAIFASGKHQKSFISKAYSGNVMAICLSGEAVFAVDVEECKFRSKEVIQHFMALFKSFEIRGSLADRDTEWFYKAWTAMESYFKLTGLGFKANKNFSIDVAGKTVYRGKEKIAWLEFIGIRGYLICVCGNIACADRQVNVELCGWSD